MCNVNGSKTCLLIKDCYRFDGNLYFITSSHKMQLYVKTPLYDNNKYLPHLLEHCVLFSSDRAEFFTYFGDIEAWTSYGCTCFEFYAPLSLPYLLQKIYQSISKETLLIQKKHLAYELKNAEYSQKLWEKLMQAVEQNSDIYANNIPKGITLDILNAYHRQWYQEQHMIFVGEDEQIDLQF
jgi:predicted Zn-dependent peptidase